ERDLVAIMGAADRYLGAMLGMELDHRAEIGPGGEIPVGDQHRLDDFARQRPEGARRAERRRLAEMADIDPRRPVLVEELHDLLGQVMHRDEQDPEAAFGKIVEEMPEERLAADFKQRLWRVLGQRTEPAPPAAGEDERNPSCGNVDPDQTK